MRSRHFCRLTQLSSNEQIIDFAGFNESEHKKSKGAGVAAMKEELQKRNLKYPEDFEIKNSGYQDGENSQITIKRPANVVVVLNYLLQISDEKRFSLIPRLSLQMSTNQPYVIAREQDLLHYWNTMLSCIENKNLSAEDALKVSTIIRAELDSAYKLLTQEPLVKQLKTKPVESNKDDFLHHPFYQTLSLLMDDYTERKANYKNKNPLIKIKATKVSEKPYQEIYKKFIAFVPGCYCDKVANSNEKKLNQVNLKKSRNVIPTDIDKTPVNNNNNVTNNTTAFKQIDPAISTKSTSSQKLASQQQKPSVLDVIKVINELQGSKIDKQRCLTQLIRSNKFTVTEFSVLYTAVMNIEGLNIHDNPMRDCFFGIKNTASWRETLGLLRNEALNALFTEINNATNETKDQRMQRLDEAKALPLFREHRNNSIFAGAFGRTASVKKIEEKIEELEQASRLSLEI